MYNKKPRSGYCQNVMRIKKRQNKYRNQRTKGFDSKREARRFQELELLEKAGEIKDLKTQVPFTFDGLIYDSGRKVRYIADFTYLQNEQFIVEDAKGMKTPLYKLKKALMKYFYEIEVQET